MKPPDVLHYFRCRLCASILIIGVKTRNYEPCNGCRSYMKWLFSEPVETEADRACAKEVAQFGRVFRWSPSNEPFINTPAKRTELPDPLTPEQIAKAKARRDAIWAEEEARMEAAYQAAEERQR